MLLKNSNFSNKTQRTCTPKPKIKRESTKKKKIQTKNRGVTDGIHMHIDYFINQIKVNQLMKMPMYHSEEGSISQVEW
jgi:hypothetical protein